MENTTLVPFYFVSVEFDWHYPGKPVSTVLKEDFFQSSSDNVGEEFVDTFIENFKIGVCTVSNIIIKSVERVYTYEEWVEKYKPILNEIEESSTYDGYAFDTHGEENDFVISQDVSKIWTMKETADFNVIMSGYHWIDRQFYFVTEIPVAEEDKNREFHVIEDAWQEEEKWKVKP